MNVEAILKLLAAGFTHDEIMELAGEQSAPDAVPPTDGDPSGGSVLDGVQQAADPAPDSGSGMEAAEELDRAPAPDPYENRFKAIEGILNTITKTLQAAAVRNTTQPETKLTLEDALEGISKTYN